MFNQYPESTDFAKIILPCMSDKRVYKSVTANTSTNLAIIKIPTRQFKNNPTLLFGAESTISGTIVFERNAAGANGQYFSYLDCNAYSLFKRVRILHGSTVLNDLNSYAQYMQCENDMTLSPSDKFTHSNMLATAEPVGGNDPTNTINLPIVTTTITTAIAAAGTPTAGVITTTPLIHNNAINISQMGFSPSYIANISSIPFSFNLKNFLGDAIGGLLPLHLITNNDLILEIEIDTCDNLQISDHASSVVASISVFDLQYNAILTHIPQSVSNLLYPNNSATLVGVDKYSDIKQIPSNISNINVQYDNFKYKYAKAVIFFFQNISSRHNAQRAFISQRSKGNSYAYSLMYNNKTYPNTKIDNVAEMFNQTLKCFNSKKSSVPLTHYTNNILNSASDDYLPNLVGGEFIAPVYAYIKKFVGGIPLQRYYTDDKHFTGIDISKNSLSLNIDLATVSYTASGVKTIAPVPIPNGLFIVLQSYCIFDVVYQIKDGEITMIK